MNQWRQSMRRWLAAEHSNRHEVAEGALTEVFEALRDPRAPEGFAAAILRRIDAHPIPVALPVTMRWMVAAAMLAAALSVAVLPLVLTSLAMLVELGTLVELAGVLLVGASRALASWLGFWQSMAHVNGLLLRVVSEPQVALVMVGILGISIVALRWVSRLMASGGSGEYA